MNWARKILQKDDKPFTLPSHDCPRCGGRLVVEGDEVRCDTCSYPDEVDRSYCEYCGDEIAPGDEVYGPNGEGPYCSEECMHEDLGDEDDEDDVCAVCGEILDSGHLTCPCCAAPLCGSEECYDAHMAEHRREWGVRDNKEDE